MKLPTGACDTHCHVFGPIDQFPLAPVRGYEPQDSPLPVLAALHAKLGVDRAVIVQASAHGMDNRAMLNAVANDPAKYRGVAMIDDSFTEADLDGLDQGGVRGIRFNFIKTVGGAPDPDVMSRAVARAADRNWHVVIHVQGDGVLEMEPVMRAFPTGFVIDHMGRVEPDGGIAQPSFQALLRLMDCDGAWVKISGAERMCPWPYEAAAGYARALIAARPERVLWGTDFPHPNLKADVREEDLVDLLRAVAGDEATLRQICVENPARLYGFA